MGFLRQNIFVLGLIGVVLVVGGVMLAMDFSTSGDTRDQIDRRTKLSNELKSAAGDPVNDRRLRAEQKRVDKIKAAAEKIADLSTRWNRGSYPVMELPIQDARGIVVKTVPAFPMDEKNKASRRLVLTGRYLEELQAILNRLKATQPPDDAEIAHETSFFQRREDQKQAAQKKREEKELLLGGSAAPSPTRAFRPKRSTPRSPGRRRRRRSEEQEYEEMARQAMEEERMFAEAMEMRARGERGGGGRMRGARAPAGRPRMARINASSEAQRQGIRSARLKKAQAGEIYVSIDSLDPVVFDVPHTASDEEMWRAQIHLWVVGDVVEAIRRTNEQKLRNLSPEQRNVLRSPVKRLVSLSVEKEYYTGGSVALLSQRRRGRTISRRRGREMRGAPDYEEEMRREEMERMGAMMGRGGARDRPTQAASPPETLTQRVCTKDYDVLHYSFTVVLPVEHLPLLQANLMRGGSHTILGMTIDEMGSGANQAGKGRQMRTRQGASEELYYYGNDPVVQVTLIGELLLMTSWERGTWDNDKNEWSTVLPPLMPVEVLDGLSRSLPDAMRSEDDRRLSELSGDEAATARPGW